MPTIIPASAVCCLRCRENRFPAAKLQPRRHIVFDNAGFAEVFRCYYRIVSFSCLEVIIGQSDVLSFPLWLSSLCFRSRSQQDFCRDTAAPLPRRVTPLSYRHSRQCPVFPIVLFTLLLILPVAGSALFASRLHCFKQPLKFINHARRN